LNEDLVADGFESFVGSQYFPNNINILVGKTSQFLYAADYAHLRRKGCMTVRQKERNAKLQAAFCNGRVSIRQSFTNLVDMIEHLRKNSGMPVTTLFTDQHRQYPLALEQSTEYRAGRIKHIRISSKLARTVRNPLFAVNYIDRQFRKDNSDHARETVQYAHSVVNCMERIVIYRFYHNYMKPYRIKDASNRGKLHGEVAGIDRQRIHEVVGAVFRDRRFLFRTANLPWQEAKVWLRSIMTPLHEQSNSGWLPNYVWA